MTPLCFPSLTRVFLGSWFSKKANKIAKNTHGISKAPVQEWGSVGPAKETHESAFKRRCARGCPLSLEVLFVDGEPGSKEDRAKTDQKKWKGEYAAEVIQELVHDVAFQIASFF